MTTSNKSTVVATDNFTLYLNEDTASGCLDSFTVEELDILEDMDTHINGVSKLDPKLNGIGRFTIDGKEFERPTYMNETRLNVDFSMEEGSGIYIRRCLDPNCPTEIARSEREKIFNQFYNAGLLGLGTQGNRKFVYMINAMKEAFGKKPVFRNITVAQRLDKGQDEYDPSNPWTNINKLFGDVWKKRNPGVFSEDYYKDIARMKIQAFNSLERYKELADEMYVGEAVQYMSAGNHDDMANNYHDHWDESYDYRRGEQVLCCPHCGSEDIILQGNNGVTHEECMMTNDSVEDVYHIHNEELDFTFVYDSRAGKEEVKDEGAEAFYARQKEWDGVWSEDPEQRILGEKKRLEYAARNAVGEARGFMEICKEMAKHGLPLQFPEYDYTEEVTEPKTYGRKKVTA